MNKAETNCLIWKQVLIQPYQKSLYFIMFVQMEAIHGRELFILQSLDHCSSVYTIPLYFMLMQVYPLKERKMNIYACR